MFFKGGLRTFSPEGGVGNVCPTNLIFLFTGDVAGSSVTHRWCLDGVGMTVTYHSHKKYEGEKDFEGGGGIGINVCKGSGLRGGDTNLGGPRTQRDFFKTGLEGGGVVPY